MNQTQSNSSSFTYYVTLNIFLKISWKFYWSLFIPSWPLNPPLTHLATNSYAYMYLQKDRKKMKELLILRYEDVDFEEYHKCIIWSINSIDFMICRYARVSWRLLFFRFSFIYIHHSQGMGYSNQHIVQRFILFYYGVRRFINRFCTLYFGE